MAKKKKAVIVLQAPKAVKRGKSKNPPHSNGRRMDMVMSRNVISNRIIRPYHRISGGDDSITVSGLELLPTIIVGSGSRGPLASNFYLNPGNTSFLKRLAATAMGYQKYRFRKLKLRYVTMCASSTSGVLSAAILLDPLEGIPQSPPEFLAYAHSLTTSVSLDGVSQERRIVDPRWYMMDTGDSNIAVVDPTSRFQGNVCWMTHGSTSSAEVVQETGYLALEYVCELTGHRPLRDFGLSLHPTGQTFTGGATSLSNSIKYDGIQGQMGSFDVIADPRLQNTDLVEGYSAATTRQDSWTDMFFRHALNYFLPLSLASIDGRPVEEEKGFIARPPFSATRTSPTSPLVLTLGGRQVDTVPNWVTVSVVDPENEEKSGVLAHPVRAKDLKSDVFYSFRGNAAGDITVNLISDIPGALNVTIDATVYSLGTGAVTLRLSVPWTQSSTSLSRVRLTVVPTGVENRTIAASSAANVSDIALNSSAILG